jgi:hypothetical protein
MDNTHTDSNGGSQKSQQDRREEILRRYFVSRTDVFAQWNRDFSDWRCIRRDIPRYLLKSHIEGRITIATYPVNSLGNTPHLCFDIDNKTAEAYAILDWLQGWFKVRGMLFLIEDTGGRGLHGWVLFLCYLAAVKAIALANLALDAYRSEFGALSCPVEIFPKQARPKDVGNPIRLPWGRHHSGRWSHFLNNSHEPDDNGAILTIDNGRKTTEFDLDNLLPPVAKRRPEQPVGHAPQELVDMLSGALCVGERRPTLVKLTGYLRYRGIPEEVAIGLLLPWAERAFSEPLPPEEVERHIRGVYGRYGLGESRLSKLLNSQALATILPQPRGKRRQK